MDLNLPRPKVPKPVMLESTQRTARRTRSLCPKSASVVEREAVVPRRRPLIAWRRRSTLTSLMPSW